MKKYKKTAKDLAHDYELQKLRSQIQKLKNERDYWKTYAEKANDSANEFERLYLEAVEHLDMTPEEFKRHLENENAAADMYKILSCIH